MKEKKKVIASARTKQALTILPNKFQITNRKLQKSKVAERERLKQSNSVTQLTEQN